MINKSQISVAFAATMVDYITNFFRQFAGVEVEPIFTGSYALALQDRALSRPVDDIDVILKDGYSNKELKAFIAKFMYCQMGNKYNYFMGKSNPTLSIYMYLNGCKVNFILNNSIKEEFHKDEYTGILIANPDYILRVKALMNRRKDQVDIADIVRNYKVSF